MIDRTHALPIKRQVQLTGVSRGSVYYRIKSVGTADLALMRRIDELHLPVCHPPVLPSCCRSDAPGGLTADVFSIYNIKGNAD